MKPSVPLKKLAGDVVHWQAKTRASTMASHVPASDTRIGPKTTGTVNYVQPPPDGSDPGVYLYKREDGGPQKNFSTKETTVDVYDMRRELDKFTLKGNGLELHRLEIPNDIDWDNAKEVSERYYPLVERLLLETTGASRVHIFDHTLRRGHIEPLVDENILKQPSYGRRLPVGMVHVDYTDASGSERLDALLPGEANDLKKTPFGVIQVWKPLKGPVKSSPLGVIDASTVRDEDFMNYSIHFENRIGKNYGIKANPGHRWYYASDMDIDEAYVFVCFDSRKDRARFTPHTGFLDHNTPANAPMRESVELRSYCFWENEA